MKKVKLLAFWVVVCVFGSLLVAQSPASASIRVDPVVTNTGWQWGDIDPDNYGNSPIDAAIAALGAAIVIIAAASMEMYCRGKGKHMDSHGNCV